MPHDVSLIALVATAFVLATIFGYLADRLRLPALVGYLIAGVVLGPFTPGFVADSSLAGQLAEMGVILLMFGVGLHFSASDLLAVKGLAIPGAIGQIVLATALGVGLTSLWGWSVGEGIVFGLCISVASTVVLLKALEERNMLDTPTGRVAVGWLIVEDLAMVLALVLLPAMAELLGGHGAAGAHGHAAGGDQPFYIALGITLAKVAAFVAIAAAIGPRVVPWVLMKVARTGSRELFTLSVLGVAMGIAFGSAAAFGVSFALGAFFAGVIMGESQLSHRAAANSLPLQDAFSVLFFVSIGMLFDPVILIQEPLKVLAVVALIILGKGVIAFGIVIAMRYPIGLALGISASLTQIGEFSFILAGIGMTYGLLTQQGQDLILAGALLSIVLNTLVFDVVETLHRALQARWPAIAGTSGLPRLRALVGELERIKALSEKKHHEQEQRIERLASDFPLFSGLDKHATEELLLLFRPKSASPGEKIIRKGDRGDAMYFLVSGAVEVGVPGRPRLEPGTFFGEMALLSGARRVADVTALDYAELLVLDRREFNQFMTRHPGLREAVSRLAEERSARNVQAADEPG